MCQADNVRSEILSVALQTVVAVRYGGSRLQTSTGGLKQWQGGSNLKARTQDESRAGFVICLGPM